MFDYFSISIANTIVFVQSQSFNDNAEIMKNAEATMNFFHNAEIESVELSHDRFLNDAIVDRNRIPARLVDLPSKESGEYLLCAMRPSAS